MGIGSGSESGVALCMRQDTYLCVHEAPVMQHLPSSHVNVDVQVQGMCVMVVKLAIAHVHESRHQAPARFLLVLYSRH